MLDFVLARVRKEPHLGSLQTFESDCDAPVSPAVLQTLRPFVTIPAFFFSSSPRNNYFDRFPQPCGPCAKPTISKQRERFRRSMNARLLGEEPATQRQPPARLTSI